MDSTASRIRRRATAAIASALAAATVGQTLDAGGQTIGFLRHPDGKVTTIDLPGDGRPAHAARPGARGEHAFLEIP